jgi:hypothetical protein
LVEATKSALTVAGSSQSVPACEASFCENLLRFDTMGIEVGAKVGGGTPVLGTLASVLVVRLGPMGTLTQVLDVGLGGQGARRCAVAARSVWATLTVRDAPELTLTREAFVQVEQRFGPHSIDRFASDISYQLPRYNTKYFLPRAEALDAFSLNWAGDKNYLFPPLSLVGHAMYHASVCGADITIVYMQWFSRTYMKSLRKYESEGKLLESIYLGHADRVLECRDSLSCGERRYQHLPRFFFVSKSQSAIILQRISPKV